MRIENDGLPQPVYEWILATQSEYSKGDADISVTELINPPRVRILRKKHDKDLVVQASTLLNSTLGTTVHKAIQASCKTGISERRLSIEVMGWKISGGMDHWHYGVLSDWKTCNKFKTTLCDNGVVEEFENQLNVYAQILRSNKMIVDKLKIFALFKDWNRSEYGRYLAKGEIFHPGLRNGYPEKEWLYFDLRLWDEEEALSYLESRVKLHQDAEKVLPLCSREETWRGTRCSRYCEPGMNGFCTQIKGA
jgi:hypothetical protein